MCTTSACVVHASCCVAVVHALPARPAWSRAPALGSLCSLDVACPCFDEPVWLQIPLSRLVTPGWRSAIPGHRPYIPQAVATAKSCFVCYRPTTTVLATVNATDFVYTCDMHLADSGFASRIPEPEAAPSPKPSVSTEEILKVKKEWEDRQKKKPATDDKEKEKKDSSKPSTPAASPPPAAPATPKHEKYTLHRDIFSMRQAEHRKRRNAAQAKEVAPRIPSAPRSSVE